MTKRAFIWDLDGTLLPMDMVLRRPMQLIKALFDRASIKAFHLGSVRFKDLVAVAEEYHLM